VRRINIAAQRAGRRGADCGAGIVAAGGAGRNAGARVQLDVGRQVTGIVDGGTGGLAFFQRKLAGGGVDLTHVIDTGVGLRGGTRFHEVRDRDRSEEADDGHNDHDFDEREARAGLVFVRFHVTSSFDAV
jgi:hypothetical protein